MRGPPCVGRMCGCRTFSLVSGLPSRLSAVGCPPLFEPFIGTTPESDSWPACLWVSRLSPFPTGLPPDCAAEADQLSRFSCMMFLDVRGVSDCAGSPVDFVFAPTFVWSSPFVIGSTPWRFSFTAPYPACPCPCLRFASSLATGGARLGVRMGHYSFPVRLFHSRHHAGLSRRTTNPPLAHPLHPELFCNLLVGSKTGPQWPRPTNPPWIAKASGNGRSLPR